MQVDDERSAIELSFDGACRGNGLSTATSSAGVFTQHFECEFSSATKLPTVLTNQGAEIAAATILVNTAIAIYKKHGHRRYTARGDSNHVITTILSGRLLTYQKYDRLPNSGLWTDLREAIETATAANITINWTWVPRRANKRADALANYALGTPLDKSITDETTSADITEEKLEQLVLAIARRGKPPRTIRTLPIVLAKQFAYFIGTILALTEGTPTRARLLFMLAPHLLSLHCREVKSRGDFKKVQSHLVLLSFSLSAKSCDNYLADCLDELRETLNAQNDDKKNSIPSDESKRIHTLCSRGLFHKTIRDTNIQIALLDDRCKTKLKSLFPQKELPQPISCPENHVSIVTFADVVRAIRRIKRGKSPGVLGWTRELLWPCLQGMMSTAQQGNALAEIFQHIVNTTITKAEQEVLKTGILVPFSYRDQEGKIRPIVLLDTLLKVSWHIVLPTDDPVLLRTVATFQKNACPNIVHVIQALVDDGKPVLRADATNAFNAALRTPMLDYVRKYPYRYARAIKMFNFMYTTRTVVRQGNFEIEVTNGFLQGCVSAPRALAMAMCETAQQYTADTLIVADDIYVISNINRIWPTLRTGFADIGLKVDGPKLMIMAKRDAATAELRSITTNIVHDGCTVLGGFITIEAGPDKELTLITPWLTKQRAKIDTIVTMQASRHDKFLILTAVSWDTLYYVKTCHAHIRQQIFDDIGHHITKAAISICEVPESHHVHLKASTEDGGCGIFPTSELAQSIHAHSVQSADLFATSRKLPTPKLRAKPATSIAAAWREWSQQAADLKHFALPPDFKSWLQCWPANARLTLNDDQFTLAMKTRCQCVTPLHYHCPMLDAGRSLSTLNPEQFTKHWLTCAHCAAIGHDITHESIVATFGRVLRENNVCVTIPPKNDREFPLPGNQSGGADFYVYSNAVYAADVTITQPAYVLQRHRFKLVKYAGLANHTSWQIAPIVANCYGIFCSKTLAQLETMLTHSVAQEVCNEAQFALLKAKAVAYVKLRMKALQQKSSQQQNS